MGMLCCAFAMMSGAFTLLVVGFALMGFMYGGNMCSMSAMAASFFRPKYYGINYAIATCQMIPAAMIGPRSWRCPKWARAATWALSGPSAPSPLPRWPCRSSSSHRRFALSPLSNALWGQLFCAGQEPSMLFCARGLWRDDARRRSAERTEGLKCS